MSQQTQPNADFSEGGWQPTPLWPHLDGPVPNDATPITSPVLLPSSSFTVDLAPLAAPIAGVPEDAAQPHTLVVRLNGCCTSAVVTLIDTVNGASRWIKSQLFYLSPGFQDYTLTLSYHEAALIEDYTTLQVMVTAYGGSSSSCSCSSSNSGNASSYSASGAASHPSSYSASGAASHPSSYSASGAASHPSSYSASGAASHPSSHSASASRSAPFSSSTSTSAPGYVVDSCCGSVPAVLYANISGLTGPCTCFNGLSIPLIWNGFGWAGTYAGCSGSGPVYLLLTCVQIGTYQLRGTNQLGGSSYNYSAALSCSNPFSCTFSGANPGGVTLGTTCNVGAGGGPGTIVVTE